MHRKNLLLGLAFLAVFVGYTWWVKHRHAPPPAPAAITVTDLLTRIDADQVTRLRIHRDQVEFRYEVFLKGGQTRICHVQSDYASQLTQRAVQHVGLQVGYAPVDPPKQESTWLWSVITYLLMACVVFARWIKKMGRRVYNWIRHQFGLPVDDDEETTDIFGQVSDDDLKPHLVTDDNRVTFADVAGIEEAEDELQEVVSNLKDPERLKRLGGLPLRGVLLIGPPGGGKTMLARAIATEAQVAFFSMSGPQFLQKYMGEGPRRVRKLFAEARKHAPAIIFIDELDSIGLSREGKESERIGDSQTLNQLLVEMDGLRGNTGIIVIAATNRPETLDAALQRAGRFDRKIHILPADTRGRCAILFATCRRRRTPIAPDVDLQMLARGTAGFSGADLANLVNEAAHVALRQNHAALTMDDFHVARDRIVMGSKSARIMSPEQLRLVATHEAGHAIVALHLPEADPIYKVTIVARGDALGMVAQLPEGDSVMFSRRKLMTSLAIALGGRLAEEQAFTFEGITTGASQDLAQATQLATRMVTEWGMTASASEWSRWRRYTSDAIDLSDELRGQIRHEIKALLEEACALAKRILDEHKVQHTQLVEALLERETLTLDEIRALLSITPTDTTESTVQN